MFFCYNILGGFMGLIIGSHVSFNKATQMLGSLDEALSYKENTFMFYTGAPQNTKRAVIDDELTKQAKLKMKENNIDIKNVVVHAPYIINLANSKNKEFNINFLKQEIYRVASLGVKNLVLHPGSHVGYGIDKGIENVVECLKEVIPFNNGVNICLETMAGRGTELGSTFEQLQKIISGVNSNYIKVCLDTCHINDAGYDLSFFDQVLDHFDKTIGLEKIAVVHINDSKNKINSHKDRHENIGYGEIGFNNLLNIIYHEKLKNVPKILETPYIEGNAPYLFEIEMIRNKKFNTNLINDCINYNK